VSLTGGGFYTRPHTAPHPQPHTAGRVAHNPARSARLQTNDRHPRDRVQGREHASARSRSATPAGATVASGSNGPLSQVTRPRGYDIDARSCRMLSVPQQPLPRPRTRCVPQC
jgi:hypothetical protein